MSGAQKVKICGISDTATAKVAVEAGADFIGIVFYPGSHRYVEPERAREIADAAHGYSPNGRTQVVGLFVNEPLDMILTVKDQAGLDVIQLSGNESTDEMAALKARDIPYLATVRAGRRSARHRSAIRRNHRATAVRRPPRYRRSGHVGWKWRRWKLGSGARVGRQVPAVFGRRARPGERRGCHMRSQTPRRRCIQRSRNKQIKGPFEDQSIYRRSTRCGR